MIKTVFIDADGVALLPRDKFFSQRLQEDFGVPLEKILPFFKNEYKKVVIGEADLKEELSKYLKDIGWNKTVDELCQYWFSYEDKPDYQVLELVKELRNQGVRCYLVSDHSKYRADNIMETLGKEFDGGFFSGYLGTTKVSPDFFTKVIQKLNLQPEEILLVDDEEENLKGAESAGIKSLLFTNVDTLKTKLQNLFK